MDLLCCGARQGHRGDGPAGLGDETFSTRILEYVGLRSKMYSILTVQPDGARKEKRKIKGVPKKAVTNVRHLEYRKVLEEGSERRAAFAQLRSRAHEIAVETVEKKSLLPFNDKVHGLDAHNSWPLEHWRNRALTLRQALRPRDGVPRGAPASAARSDTAAAAAAGRRLSKPEKKDPKLLFSRFLKNACIRSAAEKPADEDAPCLAAALMAQRPPCDWERVTGA